jgi:hypothetical protein
MQNQVASDNGDNNNDDSDAIIQNPSPLLLSFHFLSFPFHPTPCPSLLASALGSSSPLFTVDALESNNTINPLRNEIAHETKSDKPSSDANKPSEIAFVVLAGNPDVHSPVEKRCVSKAMFFIF